ncbi:MAG: nicotinic acid mononucleotide adenylyltransferase [Bacteroidetes bacterium RBG_13_44_24]|nr:MAG: nicotinic acid mononucleotide adenylyltransferase [Bacteroidetes bacterium RBG_13_44_24]
MLKVGLYFGSFNPIHIGHIAIAGYMLEFTTLEEVWFVVSPHNPLKKKETLLDNYQRLHMANLAIGNNDRIRASDIEFKLPVPSYTIDTIAYLEEKYPEYRFSLVMGEDNLYTLHKWKNAGELVKKCQIIVYPRPDAVKPSNPLLHQLLSEADITVVKAPLMDISGTFIRNGIKKNKNMSYYLPAPVWKYIEEMHFYKK